MKIIITLGLLSVLILAGCTSSNDSLTVKEFCNLEGYGHYGTIDTDGNVNSKDFICYNDPTEIAGIHYESELEKWIYFSKNRDCTKCEKTIQED